jgi:hypothetical protein
MKTGVKRRGNWKTEMRKAENGNGKQAEGGAERIKAEG